MARPVVDPLPDDATVCRLLHLPRMGESKTQLLLENYFEFTRDNKKTPYKGESLVWTLHAQPVPERVHQLGKEFEAMRRQRPKPCDYIGYVHSRIDNIRQCPGSNGHRFKVYDAPEEDADHHVEVGLDLVPGTPLRNGEKESLQLMLAQLFSQLAEC